MPPDAGAVYDDYAKHVENLGTPGERYLELHVGHCTFVPDRERRFVNPATIRSTTIVGSREEVIERLSALARAGITQIVLNPLWKGSRSTCVKSRENLSNGSRTSQHV